MKTNKASRSCDEIFDGGRFLSKWEDFKVIFKTYQLSSIN